MVTGILGIIATVIVGVAIWLIQERRNKNALKRQREDFKDDLLETLPKVLPDIMAKEHEKRTGQPVNPEIRAEFIAVAGASATILSEYVGSGGFRLAGTGPSAWDSPGLWVSMTPQEKPVDPIIIADEGKPPQAKPGKASFINPEDEDDV